MIEKIGLLLVSFMFSVNFKILAHMVGVQKGTRMTINLGLNLRFLNPYQLPRHHPLPALYAFMPPQLTETISGEILTCLKNTFLAKELTNLEQFENKENL